MRKLFKSLCFCSAAIMLSAGFVSCGNDDDGRESGEAEVFAPILKTYVDDAVVPTYKALAEAALKMRTANEVLKKNDADGTLTDADMKAAADAWMTARIEWELSEAFLYGPVSEDAMNIDAHIDSWPLEIEDINKTLKEIEESKSDFTGKEAWNKEAEVIGFHVTEYLLYRDGQPRKAADVTKAEIQYLTAATDALIWDCVLAYIAWAGEDHVSAEIKSVFNENPDVVKHLNNNSNYKNFANQMRSATGNYAGNWDGAIDEISEGAADIADEVGTTKIESPYSSGKVEDVESWYSWHSLDDYKNNILSIRNGYFGKKFGKNETASPQANSLSAYLSTTNPELDAQIKAQIEDCLTKITNIGKDGKSFYEVVRDKTNKAEVDAAVEACDNLATLFKKLTNTVLL